MTTTHAALGVLVAALVLLFDPSLAVVAAYAAYAGGVFPDLDLAAAHRRTLHYPAIYPALAAPALAVAAVRPSPLTVGVAFFLASAALHCLSEVLGGGLGRRPWLEDDERGVYSHLGDRWLTPRRVIPYDGAPMDLALCALLTVPGILLFEDGVRLLLLAGFAVSVVYTVLRKRIAEWVAI